MDATDRKIFLGSLGSIARDNLRCPETRAAFLAVAESLADNCSSAVDACAALQSVIKYGQAVAGEAYDIVRSAA